MPPSGARSHSAARQTNRAQQARERLRRSYRPASVRLLFVGEAPPASGRFFYNRDSGLYRAMRDAFRTMDPAIGDQDFLPFFQSSGCYLIDCCSQPVDQLDGQSRRVACLVSEPSLSRRIKNLEPQTIATLVRSIRGNVARAASRAGWQGTVLDLPYPGRWIRHRESFLSALTPQLKELLRRSSQ